LGAPVKQNRNETSNKTTLLAHSPYSSNTPSGGNLFLPWSGRLAIMQQHVPFTTPPLQPFREAALLGNTGLEGDVGCDPDAELGHG